MASQEQSQTSQSSANAPQNQRVILRLRGFEGIVHLGDRAGFFQRSVRNGQTKLLGNTAIASDAEHIYIDTVRPVVESPIDALAKVIEEIDDSVTACGLPAEIDAARMSNNTHLELTTQYAWLEMGRDETTDVTPTALVLAAAHYQRDFDDALEHLLPHAS